MQENLDKIYQAILKGDINAAPQAVTAAIEAEIEIERILNKGLISAMEEVGRRYEEGIYFVPEMLISARAMQKSMGLLKPHLVKADTPSAGKVVIGTVKGDLHDIGKNLVAMMLEGAGFEVLDIGTDADPAKFVEAVEDGYRVIAMSALLTTTMNNMKEVIAAVEEGNMREDVKIIIGGAPVTQAFTEQIGADGFAIDASSAVRMVKKLTT